MWIQIIYLPRPGMKHPRRPKQYTMANNVIYEQAKLVAEPRSKARLVNGRI